MRDPTRIPLLLQKLEQAWSRDPDQRLCQFILNLTYMCTPTFYIEDDKMESLLDRYIANEIP